MTPDAKEIFYEFEQSYHPPAGSGLTKNFSLGQNFPDPFNAITQIRYTLPENAQVRLEILNILGQRVKVLVDEFQTAGYQQVIWDGKNDQGDMVSSGVYFYRISAGECTAKF